MLFQERTAAGGLAIEWFTFRTDSRFPIDDLHISGQIYIDIYIYYIYS